MPDLRLSRRSYQTAPTHFPLTRPAPRPFLKDPELSPVESFSSRGPCIVNGETRLKPTTTAADGVTTSTPGNRGRSATSSILRSGRRDVHIDVNLNHLLNVGHIRVT